MGLKHLTSVVETVETPGGSFTVRGLSLEDITSVVRANATLADLFTRFAKATQDGVLIAEDMTGMAGHLVDAAPKAVAQIISLAASEDDLGIAAAFPFPVQIDALEKIGRLTFGTENGAKKALETIVRVAKGIGAAISSQKP